MNCTVASWSGALHFSCCKKVIDLPFNGANHGFNMLAGYMNCRKINLCWLNNLPSLFAAFIPVANNEHLARISDHPSVQSKDG